MSVRDSLDLFDLGSNRHGRDKTNHAYLPRPDSHSEFARYSARDVAGEVYIHANALRRMREIALDASPNETIGILCGRPCVDDRGEYTLVMAVEQARAAEYVGTPGSVRISAAGRAALKARAARLWAGWEDVGWYHTHPRGAPRFSSTDLDEQSTLMPHQVGIVSSVEHYRVKAADPLGVYLGPSGERLTDLRPASMREIALPPESGKKVIEPARIPPRVGPSSPKRIVIGVAAATALVLVSQALTAIWVRTAVGSHPLPVVTNTGATAHSGGQLEMVPQARPLMRPIPSLFATRNCNVGDRLRLTATVPRNLRAGLTVVALRPKVVAVGYDLTGQVISVRCLAPGDTASEIRHGDGGPTAAVAITVTQPVTAPNR